MRVQQPQVSSRRIYELDVLRGIAALGVVLYHYTTRYDQLYGHSSELAINFAYGRFGVPLFFMISGFVILMSLERTQRLLDFVIGRIARLYPAYWVAIALTFGTVALLGLPGREVGLPAALVNLTMIQRFIGIPDVDGVYWTLQVELCFYVVMMGIHQLRLLKHIETVAIAWLLFNLVRVQFDIIYLPAALNPFALTEYAHLFIIGLTCHQVWKYGGSVVRYGMIAAGLMIHGMLSPGAPLIACMVFAFILFLATHGYLRQLSLKPLVFLGTVSYSLYLIHQNIGYIVLLRLSNWSVNAYLSIAIALIMSLAIATLMAYGIERPATGYLKTLYRQTLLRWPIFQSQSQSTPDQRRSPHTRTLNREPDPID
jgi:peptidoglycan/LPS O-acetylase OafA/YrhL